MPYTDLSVPERYSHAARGNYEPTGFGPCVGVQIHSTDGMGRTLQGDYIGTINWFQNPAAEVSATVVVGPAEVNHSLEDDEVGYHGRDPDNHRRRSIEIAMPANSVEGYNDFQYEATAEIIARWKIKDELDGVVWPIKLLTPEELAANPVAKGIALHRDTPKGRADGKIDPINNLDVARIVRRAQEIYARLVTGSGHVPTPANNPITPVTPSPGTPGHWPNGRVIASSAEYDAHVWGALFTAYQHLQAAALALKNGGNGILGDDADAADILSQAANLLAIKQRNEQAHGISR